MRRLFAFITLAITLIGVAVVGIPTIKDTTKSGTEFDGGYSILYHVTDIDGLSYRGNALKNNMAKATKNINTRLNALNISYPEVSTEGNDYIRVTVPKSEESQLSTIRYALANNSKITVRDADDNLLAKGEDVFSKLTLTMSEGVVYISVKISDYDKFEEITKAAAEKASASTTTNQSGEQQAAVALVLWTGFEETYSETTADSTGFKGDKYAEAQTNGYAAWKVLTAITLEGAITEDFGAQAAVSANNVAIMNKIISSDPVNYVIQEEYTSPVGSLLGENVPTRAIIAGIVAIAIIAIFMVIAYHFAGIASVLSLFVYAVVVLLLYNLFGGLFGTETIVAMLIGIGLAVDANVVFLERIKDEIRKGKSIRRSYQEGSKKSVSTVLDANVLVIVAAFALYLFGNQVVKSFAAIMIISEVAIMVIVVLLTRLMFSLLCKSSKAQGHANWFGVKADEISDVNNLEEHTSKEKFKKVNFVKSPKKLGIISGGIVAVGVVVALIFQFVSGSFFNFNSQMSSGTRIYFQTVNPEFATVEKVQAYFADESKAGLKPNEVVIGTDTITVSDNDLFEYYELFSEYGVDSTSVSRNKVTVYNVTATFNRKLDAQSVETINTIFEAEEAKFYDEDNDIKLLKTNYSLNNYESYSGGESSLNALIALAVLLGFSIIYLTIRFTLSYSLTAVATIIHNVVITLAVLAFTRIPFSVEAIAACLAVVIFTINNLVITFDRLRENVSEAGNVIWNKETRREYINKSLQQTMYGHLFTTIATLVGAIAVLAISGVSIIPLGIMLVLGIIASTYGSYLVMPHLWVYLDGAFASSKDKHKKRAASKTHAKVDSGESEEYVFFGIND